MKVVVAGAGGYVGGRLVDELLHRDGVDVVALARKPRPWLEHVEQRAVDLRDRGPALADALAGADAVVHLAGPSEVHAAAEPERVLADTVAISTNLGVAAREAGCGRFVYLSTTHVYGARVVQGAVLTEDLRPEPRHPYAIARLASEHALAGLGVEPVCLRLTNSVGAPVHPDVDRWTLVVNDLCRQAVTTGELRLNTDGMQWRDFVSLADAVRLIADLAGGAGEPGVWNLGSGTPWRVRDVAELVAATFERLGAERPPLHAPDPQDDPPEASIVDMRALTGLGLQMSTPLEAAVEEIAAFCLEEADTLHRGEKMTDIDGLIVTPLRKIPDERGAVFHMLRDDSDVYERFGEIYFSYVYPGVVKGWHLHHEMTLNYAVPVGMVKLVCYDDRDGSSTRGNLVELHVGDLNYCLVTIPPLVWNGFKGEGTVPALVANCSTIPHRPGEIERLDPHDNDIPYNWSLLDG